jgi:hypothetical protein
MESAATRLGIRRLLAATGAAALLAVACSGSSSSNITDGTSDGGPSAGSVYTLDDVCDRTAPKICELRKSCCDRTGGFDQTGCLAHAKTECAKDVADARGGRATFRPETIDPCIEKFKPLLDACYETFDLILRAVNDLRACRTFEGQLAEGASCERDSQCKPSTAADELSGCPKDKLKCTTTKILAEGAACSLDSGGPSAFCGSGLYCDATGTKTCKKSTAVGSACNAKASPSLECGLGKYCDPATALCANGKGGTASCKDLIECASLKCEGAGTTGKTCVAPKALVSIEECKGP